MCGRRFIGDVGVVVVGSPFAVPCGNRPVGGAGGGLEERTVQVKGLYCRTDLSCQAVLISCLSHLHVSASVLMEV